MDDLCFTSRDVSYDASLAQHIGWTNQPFWQRFYRRFLGFCCFAGLNNHMFFARNKWVFPNIGVPQNGGFIMENPIKMDDLGGPPLFLETPKWQMTNKFNNTWIGMPAPKSTLFLQDDDHPGLTVVVADSFQVTRENGQKPPLVMGMIEGSDFTVKFWINVVWFCWDGLRCFKFCVLPGFVNINLVSLRVESLKWEDSLRSAESKHHETCCWPEVIRTNNLKHLWHMSFRIEQKLFIISNRLLNKWINKRQKGRLLQDTCITWTWPKIANHLPLLGVGHW